MPSSPEEAVLAANQAFYTAFRERDATAMEHLWAVDHPVACIHPGWAPLLGRSTIMASWRAIFGSADPPRVEMTDAHAVVLGSAAFVICVEHIPNATIAATNAFVKENGEWRLVHHHGSPMPSGPASRRTSRQMN